MVYSIESTDLPPGVAVEDVAIDATVEPEIEARPDLGDPVVGLRLPATRESTRTPTDPWPYTDEVRIAAGGEPAPAPAAIEIRAIPYFAWANRAGGAMRVWLPTTVERRPEDIDDDPR